MPSQTISNSLDKKISYQIKRILYDKKLNLFQMGYFIAQQFSEIILNDNGIKRTKNIKVVVNGCKSLEIVNKFNMITLMYLNLINTDKNQCPHPIDINQIYKGIRAYVEQNFCEFSINCPLREISESDLENLLVLK